MHCGDRRRRELQFRVNKSRENRLQCTAQRHCSDEAEKLDDGGAGHDADKDPDSGAHCGSQLLRASFAVDLALAEADGVADLRADGVDPFGEVALAFAFYCVAAAG